MINVQRGRKAIVDFLLWLIPWVIGYVPGKMLRALLPGVQAVPIWEKTLAAMAAATVFAIALAFFSKLSARVTNVIMTFAVGIGCGIIT